ncbi:MAG: DNA repair protein RecO [Oscillospiraceae bacterium]|jgi:DNA repair protein RecO (recombination protein O)|nr:DNA repair protein RecO [Oscillospiraceae bacterium]
MISSETEGIVLHRAEYREADRMLTIISPETGRVDILARGIRKPTAKLHAASELFTRGIFQLADSGGRFTLTGFQLIDAYTQMRGDYTKLSLASYALGLTAAAAQENLPAHNLYEILRLSLEEFCAGESGAFKTSLLHAMRFAAIEGIFPTLDKCCVCGEPDEQLSRFSAQEGGLCHKSCAPYSTAVSCGIVHALQECANSEPLTEEDGVIQSAFKLMRSYIREQLGFSVKAEKALDQL